MPSAPNFNVRDALPTVTAAKRRSLLTNLLRGVSRSFYLTLRVLPANVREPVGLAYLLARAADTIADTRLLAPQDLLNLLLTFRAELKGPATARSLEQISSSLNTERSNSSEEVLLRSLPELFSILDALAEEDRKLVRDVVTKLTQGMEMDLRTFPPEDSNKIVALKEWEELDLYTYYVAGCVGEFWTAITIAHTPALKKWDLGQMSKLGIRFGKALQLTNVLRDVPKDLRIGRSYLPELDLTDINVTPDQLLDSAATSKARPLLVAGINSALDHYRAAEEYLLAIPRRCVRLRLAALWPVLIGIATLAELAANERWLDPSKPSKVTRKWIYRMMLLSLPCVFSNALLRSWIDHLQGRVKRALDNTAQIGLKQGEPT